jgi:DNA-binding protein H-NS
MKTTIPTIDEFLIKIESLKEKSGVDLSTTEDLSLAVMNLISLEEHFFFTGVKIKKDEYFDTAEEIRELRKELLKELMPNHEGETWCISKHLLSTTMRLIEVGNKLQSENKKDEAKKMFERAYKVYSIFWALKLKLIDGQLINNEAKTSSNLEDLVGKLANCCNE